MSSFAASFQIRVYWYLTMSLLEDEEAQRKGVVAIFYNVGIDKFASMLDSSLMRNGTKSMESLPLRLTGIHYCYDDARLLPALSISQLVIRRQGRLRLRVHYGE
jgi:hypothetical protein